MNKNLKDTFNLAKGVCRKDLLNLNYNIELTIEPNYQALALLVEELNIIMDKEKYELIKDDKERLIYEMALLTFNEKKLISHSNIEFKERIIKEYIDVDNTVLIDDQYCFIIKINKLQKLYNKAYKQIVEGKFKNVIF